VRGLELEVGGGHRKGTKITEKGDLIMGKIIMGRGLVGLVPVDVEIVCIHGNPVDIGTVHIHGNPVNVATVHVHGSIQTGV